MLRWAAFGNSYRSGTGTRTISAAGRARIAAAQRARWAKQKSKAERPKKREDVSSCAEEGCCSTTGAIIGNQSEPLTTHVSPTVRVFGSRVEWRLIRTSINNRTGPGLSLWPDSR